MKRETQDALHAGIHVGTIHDVLIVGEDLRGVDFPPGVRLERCRFVDCLMDDASMMRTALQDVTFTRCDLNGARFEDAALYGVFFDRCNLRDTNWVWAAASEEVVFAQCDATGATFKNASLSNSQAEELVRSGARPPEVVIRDDDGSLYAYKAVEGPYPTIDGVRYYTGPVYPDLEYVVGEYTEVEDYDTDRTHSLCGRGINVATFNWCREEHPSSIILRVKFTEDDILSVPLASNGKFRVRKCFVTGVAFDPFSMSATATNDDLTDLR